jgi:hypothetical protein
MLAKDIVKILQRALLAEMEFAKMEKRIVVVRRTVLARQLAAAVIM